MQNPPPPLYSLCWQSDSCGTRLEGVVPFTPDGAGPATTPSPPLPPSVRSLFGTVVRSQAKTLFFLRGITLVFDVLFSSWPELFCLKKSCNLMYMPKFGYTEVNRCFVIRPKAAPDCAQRSASAVFPAPRTTLCLHSWAQHFMPAPL